MTPLLQYADPALYGAQNPAAMAGIMAMFAAFFLVFLVFMAIFYIYFSLTLMKTAQKLKTENSWLAWIPIGNSYLMSKMAKMSWKPLLTLPIILIFTILGIIGGVSKSMALMIISIIILIISMLILAVFSYIWIYKICQARQRPGWWALIPLASIVLLPIDLIPFIRPIFSNLVSLAVLGWTGVMWGILAWGK